MADTKLAMFLLLLVWCGLWHRATGWIVRPLQPSNSGFVLHQHSLPRGKIHPRTVPITDSWNITVFEFSETSELVNQYWNKKHGDNQLDPFGLVNWPGSVLAVHELLTFPDTIRDRSVLILGAGVGVEAQAAAHLGARSVLATDVHPTTLELLRYGAEHSNYTISTRILDIACLDEQRLPDSDVLIVADVLYNEELASHVIHRIVEARNRTILVADSQRFVPAFEGNLCETLGYTVEWEPRYLEKFTGSGVLVDETQTYDIKGQILWINRE